MATKDAELAVIEKEMNPLLEKAKKIEIRDEKGKEIATEELSKLNLMKDRVTERMETITVPAKATIKAAEAIWKPFIVAAKEAIEDIRSKLGDYQTAKVEEARAAEAAIAERIAPGKGNLSVEKGIERMAKIERPTEKVVSESGSVKFREDAQFEVMDIALLPLEYHLADEVRIRAEMKKGVKLAGVRYFTKMVPINSR